MNLIESLDYNPVQLSFGTSGLRGLVTDMTDLECYINTAGFLKFLENHDGLKAGSSIFIAGDLRDSTDRIMYAVSQAISDAGHTFIYCGKVPTPALACYAGNNSSACVMVTGSHIPADRNGIKFYKTSGEVLKSDETSIKICVDEQRGKINSQDFQKSNYATTGMFRDPGQLPPPDTSAEVMYKQRYTSGGTKPLAGKHIIVYQHSSVGRDLLVEVLELLGARVSALGRSEAFIPIDTENVTSQDKDYFKSIADQYPDNFAIVSVDGDSDRPFVIDEQGTFYRGDVLGCLVAQYLHADFSATPISCNDAVDVFLKSNNIKSVHTKIGSPYVIDAMQASSPGGIKVGWEVNGGFLLDSDAEFESMHLTALPTRDAFLPILAVLGMASQKEIKISELFSSLPNRYTGGGLVDNVDQTAINAFKTLTQNLGQSEKFINTHVDTSELGAIIDVNNLDGLRVSFAKGDIIHIRPSGNAPQLRIYTNSDSQERADDFANLAVSSDGLLETLIKELVAHNG